MTFDNLSLTAANVVPEPSTWAVVLGGGGVLLVIQRRRFITRG